MGYSDPEKRRAWAREHWHRVKKGNPKYQRVRTDTEKARRKELYGLREAAYRKEWYQKNREQILERARQKHKEEYVPRISGEPGSVRFEAKLAGFKSGFERSFASDLRGRGIKFEYETLKIPYTLEGMYSPDWIIGDMIIETKGVLDRDSKRKMIAVKTQHPELDIRFCFMSANKKVPGTKQTHAQWAEKNGFQWCEGKVPEEWLNSSS